MRIQQNFFSKKDRELFIIAGPCGAESRDQMVSTALAVSPQKPDLIRAGIWKPRTRPGTFQGAGSIGLEWLKEASSLSGIPVTVEVAGPKHVEECLKAGIDVLWIGARTTVNPFLLQEIADALRGTGIPVMIKNPVNPDLELWIGAIERISKAGITDIAAIHRGFSSYEKNMYRNKPRWEIPVELKRRIPGLPVFCDPSHICGNTRLIQSVAQTAIDMDFDGLMIETHIDPSVALSDKEQQLTPDAFSGLLDKLAYRRPAIEDSDILGRIETLREHIDELDNELLDILAKRMERAREIGELKKECNATILQRMRWEEIIRSRMKTASGKMLGEDFIFRLFEAIHHEAISQQSGIMNESLKVKEIS